MSRDEDDTAVSMTTSEVDNLMNGFVAALFITAVAVYLGAGVFYLSEAGSVKDHLISGFIVTSITSSALVTLYHRVVLEEDEDGQKNVDYPDEDEEGGGD